MLKKLYDLFIDFVFPVTCVVCHEGDNYLCPSCFKKITLIKDNKCFYCGNEKSNIGICAKCLDKSFIDEIYIPAHYSGTVIEKIIHSLKFDFIEELSKIVSELIIEKISDKNFKSAIIIPVPLHKKRFLVRGFNQSELIAKELSLNLNLKIVTNCLHRTKNTSQQAKLHRLDRIKNLNQAFQCVNEEIIRGKTILLVDDVFTTGATMNAAAYELKNMGAEKVIALAVAHE